MNAAQIEERLVTLFGKSNRGEGAPEFIITVRRHEDYEKLLKLIDDYEKQLDRNKLEMSRLYMYADENLILYDQLKTARNLLRDNGLDYSFIRNVK